MPGSVKVGGAWKTVAGASVKVGGAWKTVSAAYTKIGGTWKQWFSSQLPNFYWLTRISSGTDSTQNHDITADVNGNIYIGGQKNTNFDLSVMKLNAQGVMQWQRSFGQIFANGYGVKTDSLGNVYVVGMTESYAATVAKFNPNGDFLWSRRVRASFSSQQSSAHDVAIDASNNVYLATSLFDDGIGLWGAFLVKFDANGNTVWQRGFRNTRDTWANAVTVKGSNVYLGGAGRPTSSSDHSVMIWKFDLEGNLVSQGGRGIATNIHFTRGIDVDNSGNIYTASYDEQASRGHLIKWDSNCAYQWHQLVGGELGAAFRGVSVDAVGDVYASGNHNTAGQKGFFAKFNSSGALQYQRQFTNITNSGGIYAYRNEVLGNALLLSLSCVNNGAWNMMPSSLPIDGSLTGNYAVGDITFTYGAGTAQFPVAVSSGRSPAYTNLGNVLFITIYSPTITTTTATSVTKAIP